MAKAKKGAEALDLPVRAFASAEAWRGWLEEHHGASRGLWVKFAKRDSGVASVYYPQALEVALCFGWIDGQVRRFNERYYLQRFTPRARRSKWSKINCGKAEALIAQGLMAARGLAEIEAARREGRWAAAYDSPKNARVPADLRAALGKHKRAAAFFEKLNARNRYAILYRLQNAKRPETRARWVERIVTMMREGRGFHM